MHSPNHQDGAAEKVINPAEQQCPNCGTMAPLDMALCPRCGMALSAPSKTIHGCGLLLFQGFLALLVILLGPLGFWLALFGVLSPSEHLPIVLIGALLLASAWACVWMMLHIEKSLK
jgi:predicted nucleic acid-binding Zn ribbon protein